jgi:hypothetical protein
MKKKTAKKKKVTKAPEKPIVSVYEEATHLVADAFHEGYSESAITEKVKQAFPILNDAGVQIAIHRGSKLIADQHSREGKSVVALHVRRYNKEIKDLLEGKNAELESEDLEEGMDGVKRRKIRIYQLQVLLNVLYAKEKVLQLHKKDTQVKIFNKLNAKVTKRKPIDLKALSLEEKVEFLQLIQKTKPLQNELVTIKSAQVKQEQQITEDIPHEEIKKLNVEQVVTYNEKKEAPAPKSKKSLDNVTDKLKAALQRKALLEIRSKGGDKQGPHITDYTEI